MCARCERLERHIQDALNELGVPQPGYPQPVANAVYILRAALSAPEPQKCDLGPPGFECGDCDKCLANTIATPRLCREMNAEQEPIACDKQSTSNRASNPEPKCEVCGKFGGDGWVPCGIGPTGTQVPCPACGGGR